MGLSPASMKGALKLRLEKSGVMCRTVTEAMELVFDFEEEQRRNNTEKNNSYDGMPITEEVGSGWEILGLIIVNQWDYKVVYFVVRVI